MRSKGLWRLAVGLGVLVTLLVIGSSGASSADVQHGIGFTKGCTSPTKVGDPYSCTFTVRNILDEANDTLTISQLTDTVHSAGGNVAFSTVLDSAPVVASLGATCTAPPNRVCTLPAGGRVDIGPFTHYTVTAADFAGANPLTDDASLQWNDTCNNSPPPSNCNPNPPNVGAASQAILVRRASQTATTIHSATHGAVTVSEAGSVVHDFVAVTTNDPSPLQATPSGTVTVAFFTNNQCTAPAAATSAPIALAADGTVDATSFPQGPLNPGFYGFQATYSGDGTYAPSTGVCEPLQVVDANIQITPATATNPLNTNHVLTCHINVNDGTGQVNAPDGTVCTVAIIAGPGTPATQNCTTTGGTGSCTATITSATPGTSTIRASTNVTVAGLVLHRETGDAHAGDGPDAQKLWISPDANIQISPAQATDPVGDTHVLTGHVNVAPDGSTFANAPAGTLITFSIVSGPGTFVGGVNTCTTVGTTGECTVAITSSTAGTTVIRAATDVTVSGVVLHRETNDALPGDSSDANKTWVPPGGLIAPTQTTCNDVLNNTAQTLGQINYTLAGGKIAQSINPGVFFFYSKITTSSPNQTVTVTETNTSTNNTPNFGIQNGQAWLWSGDCSSKIVGTTSGPNGENASFTVPLPGNYIIGIKYQTKTIAGAPAPVPANITYNFNTSLGGSTGGSVLLKKQ